MFYDLGALRDMARLSILDAKFKNEQGLVISALENCLTVIKASRLFQQRNTTIIEQLVGVALGNLGHNEILAIIERNQLSKKDLVWLQQRLEDIYSAGYPEFDMQNERYVFKDLIQHIFTDSGPGGGHLIPKKLVHIERTISSSRNDVEFADILLFAGPAMYHAYRNETVQKADEVYGEMRKIAKLTPYQRHEQDNPDEQVIVSIKKWKYFLINMFMPNFVGVSDRHFQGRALCEATLAIIALQRYKLDKGEYPEKLEQLVEAGYLFKIPADPYSADSLIYKKNNDGFTLYSLSRNFIDDGGTVFHDDRGGVKLWDYSKGDAVFWPVPKELSDAELQKRREEKRRPRGARRRRR